jgi:hypothetical protein
LLGHFLDILLTLRVKRAGGGSDKALRLDQQSFCPGAFHAGSNSRPLHPIPFPDDDYLLTFQLHVQILSFSII